MLLGINRNRLALRPYLARAMWEEDLKAHFRVSSATCFIQSGKGSDFSRVVDLDPIILFRPGRFGINDFTFVAEIA